MTLRLWIPLTSGTTSSDIRYGSSLKVSAVRPQCHVRRRLIVGPVTDAIPFPWNSSPTASPKRRASSRSHVAPRAITFGNAVAFAERPLVTGACSIVNPPARIPFGPSDPPGASSPRRSFVPRNARRSSNNRPLMPMPPRTVSAATSKRPAARFWWQLRTRLLEGEASRDHLAKFTLQDLSGGANRE